MKYSLYQSKGQLISPVYVTEISLVSVSFGQKSFGVDPDADFFAVYDLSCLQGYSIWLLLIPGPLLTVHGVCWGGESSWFLQLRGAVCPHSGPARFLRRVRRCSEGPGGAGERASSCRLTFHPEKRDEENGQHRESPHLDSRSPLLGRDRCRPCCSASRLVDMWDGVFGEQSAGTEIEMRKWMCLFTSHFVSHLHTSSIWRR